MFPLIKVFKCKECLFTSGKTMFLVLRIIAFTENNVFQLVGIMFAPPGKTVALLKFIMLPLVGNKSLILGKMFFTDESMCFHQ